ncbi:MAG: bifunctional hydroxymethylpyrimidine kinase/phosphomethylpyrimidine kinase [Opitutaceae bacterium]|nr:bifunctional hydroxymethylpyrimidine kinase/phosphomethylpyrimidine kinase [Opitutaceae bacterium]
MSISAYRTRALLQKIRQKRILVVGDVMLDHYIWGNATRISPEAPVPVVEVSRDSYVPGGAANVAVNCTSMGANAVLAGYIGSDDAGLRLRQVLEEKGVETLPLPGGGATIIKSRVILQHQQLCRLDREDPPEAYHIEAKTATKRLRAAIEACDAVIFSDYAKGLVSDELITAVTAVARERGCIVALDPKPKRPMRFSGLDLVTPNRGEAAQLAGIEWRSGRPFPSEEVCRRIHEKHQVKNLVITLSEDGLLLSREGRVVRQIPTAAREVADTSGAGDTSLAAIVLALAVGADLETAAHFANAAAGVVVGKLGTATVVPAELLAYVSHRP